MESVAFTRDIPDYYLDLLILREMGGNPYLTRETILMRIFKKLAQTAGVPWENIVDVSRTCFLNHTLHLQIASIWDERKRTADEQHCFERLMGNDHVRITDLVKFANILAKGPLNKKICKLFAVDGFLGSDLKRYVVSFKEDEVNNEHVRAVRELYNHVDTPDEIKSIVQAAFDKQTDASPLVSLYVERVPKIDRVKELKLQQAEVKLSKKPCK